MLFYRTQLTVKLTLHLKHWLANDRATPTIAIINIQQRPTVPLAAMDLPALPPAILKSAVIATRAGIAR